MLRVEFAKFDEHTNKIAIMDPVKTFYIASNKKLTTHTNYYVCMFIDEELIVFTNKFDTITDKITNIPLVITNYNDNSITSKNNIYKLDLFAEETTLPFNILEYSHNKISFKGGIYTDGNIEYIDTFTEVFYEKKNQYLIKFEKNLFVEKDNGMFQNTGGCVYVKLHYHDSELANNIRKENSIVSYCKPLYNADNILRCMNGFCGLAYPIDKFSLNHKIDMDAYHVFD